MTTAKDMLDTYPGSFGFDADALARTIGALDECATTCTQCADACLAEDDVAAMARCIRLNLDCADICATTSRVISRQTAYDADITRALLQACATACGSCGDECEGHGEHMAHCRLCAEACRRCQQACESLLRSMS